jgi:hypothetical protein
MISAVTWPRGLPVARFEQHQDVRQFLSEVAGHVMGATCMVKDVNTLLDGLYSDEALQQRMSMIAVVPNSYNRITSRNFSRLSDWEQVIGKSYPLRDQGVILPRIVLAHRDESLDETDAEFEVDNHRRMGISSVIDVHAWDQASWQGCGYAQMGYAGPPCMVFLFENSMAARKIFERWRFRFGEDDNNEKIAISIIRNLTDTNPHHYCVQITSNHQKSSRPVVIAAKSMIMEPVSSENLDRFLVAYRSFGIYYLMPGVGKTNPEFFCDLTIKRRNLCVKSASEVSDQDIESLALRTHGIKLSH